MEKDIKYQADLIQNWAWNEASYDALINRDVSLKLGKKEEMEAPTLECHQPISIQNFIPLKKYNNGNPVIPEKAIQFALSSFMNHQSGKFDLIIGTLK